MNLEILQLLAEVYGTTPDALLFDPSESSHVDRLRRASEVLKKLPSEDAESWLGVGRAMAKATNPPEKK